LPPLDISLTRAKGIIRATTIIAIVVVLIACWLLRRGSAARQQTGRRNLCFAVRAVVN